MMGGPTTFRASTSNRTEAYPPGTPHVGLSNRTEAYPPGTQYVGLSNRTTAAGSSPMLRGPASPGAAILAERQRLEAKVAELAAMAEGALRDVATLRAALTDLLVLSQVQVLLTPEREAILHRAERAMADTAPPAGA